MFGSILAAAALAAAPATPATMTTKDPVAFSQQLTEFGYKPDAPTINHSNIQIPVQVGDRKLVMVLGGCTANRDCTYLAVLGSFSDVKNPPADWVAKENVNYDLIKVGTNEAGILIYSSGMVIEGMPKAGFKTWIDLVVGSSNQLADDAIKAKLVK